MSVRRIETQSPPDETRRSEPKVAARIRPARADDDVALLLYESGPPYYDLSFGDRQRSLRALRSIAGRPGNAASIEVCIVAERDGELVGVLAGYPYSEGARRGRRIDVHAFRRAAPWRWSKLVRIARAERSLDPPIPPGSWYIDALAVTQEHRRAGVGRALLAEAEARARAAGCRLLSLHTGIDNSGARAFYKAAGMEVRGTVYASPAVRALGIPDRGGVSYVKEV
jgi:ribosomal protein S18 acetylase RimI-like enzyme